MNLKLSCPACHRDDQFVKTSNLNQEAPDDTLIACACGTVTRLGLLKANLLKSNAVASEAQRLAREAAARALGKLLK